MNDVLNDEHSSSNPRALIASSIDSPTSASQLNHLVPPPSSSPSTSSFSRLPDAQSHHTAAYPHSNLSASFDDFSTGSEQNDHYPYPYFEPGRDYADYPFNDEHRPDHHLLSFSNRFRSDLGVGGTFITAQNVNQGEVGISAGFKMISAWYNTRPRSGSDVLKVWLV